MRVAMLVIVAMTSLDWQPDRRLLYDVLRRGFFGLRDFETAAFVVRDPDGTIRCLFWPETNRFRTAEYRARVPAGTVAIVHSHPVTLPKPSDQDRFIAMRLGIPVYVVTPHFIYRADPDGQLIAMAWNRKWFRR